MSEGLLLSWLGAQARYNKTCMVVAGSAGEACCAVCCRQSACATQPHLLHAHSAVTVLTACRLSATSRDHRPNLGG